MLASFVGFNVIANVLILRNVYFNTCVSLDNCELYFCAINILNFINDIFVSTTFVTNLYFDYNSFHIGTIFKHIAGILFTIYCEGHNFKIIGIIEMYMNIYIFATVGKIFTTISIKLIISLSVMIPVISIISIAIVCIGDQLSSLGRINSCFSIIFNSHTCIYRYLLFYGWFAKQIIITTQKCNNQHNRK